ncbi:MAG: hypothetical protein H7Y00_13890, partial [Fimbriimonadaceae bacterium]|nr:hypothetical protein [Chitinophagales bacterium]
LVIQWDFYMENGHLTPMVTNTWGDYKKYGNIYLAGERGTRGKLTDIHVWKSLPESIFTNKEIPGINKIKS